jgi:hypothetical protein
MFFRVINTMKEIKYSILSAVCAAMILMSCATEKSTRYQKEDARFGSTESVNYEYTNKNIVDDAREAHYLVNVEIEDPSIAYIQLPEINEIHVAAPVNGSALVQITTDAGGKVLKYAFVKRAGLGLDEYVDKIMSSIVVKPVMRKGEKSGSVFTARFVFCERR